MGRPSHGPAHIGRYEIISPLGAGGMARVYLAVQRGPVAAKVVVIKHLRPEFAHERDYVDMFVDEARIAVRLSHPNVIHTYEASTDGDEHYLVMEFLEGRTLAQLLRAVGREHLSLGLQLWIICEVLAGLSYAHELRDFDGTRLEIVHRDVSPSNVFITRSGEVKVMDFGIAKVTGAVSETQHGVVKGKIGYASPEQCMGRPADARSDIYSVGVILWEAIAGRRRAAAETALAAVQARVEGLDPDIEQVRPGIDPVLVAIVRRALSFEPETRYPTASAFHAELDDYLQRSGFTQGPLHVSSLLAAHFAEEMSLLRRGIDEHIGSTRMRAAKPSIHEVVRTVTPLSVSPVQRTLPVPSQPKSLAQRAGQWALAVSAVALVSALAYRFRSTTESAVHDQAAAPADAASQAPPATADSAMAHPHLGVGRGRSPFIPSAVLEPPAESWPMPSSELAAPSASLAPPPPPARRYLRRSQTLRRAGDDLAVAPPPARPEALSAAEPGADLPSARRALVRAPRNIDEQDPYR